MRQIPLNYMTDAEYAETYRGVPVDPCRNYVLDILHDWPILCIHQFYDRELNRFYVKLTLFGGLLRRFYIVCQDWWWVLDNCQMPHSGLIVVVPQQRLCWQKEGF